MNNYCIGNWKMHGQQAMALEWINQFNLQHKRLSQAQLTALPEMIICPPYPLLAPLRHYISRESSRLLLGAQNCHQQLQGEFTGEVSAKLLRDFECKFVILGHSERRQHCKETSEQVKAKALIAQQQEICPIICVGESAAIRNSGDQQQWVSLQLTESLPGTGPVIIAYEPVWAIGADRTPQPEEIAAMAATIREKSNRKDCAVLYGGSVKPHNARELFKHSAINGFLIGGASLAASDFLAIAAAVN